MALEGLLKRQYTIKQALISGILASVASIGKLALSLVVLISSVVTDVEWLRLVGGDRFAAVGPPALARR
jgi:hypothetical protein